MGNVPMDRYVDAKLLDRFSVDVEDLTKDQRTFLLKLNDKLSKFEKEKQVELIKLDKIAGARLKDPKDWVTDYEIECDLTFILNKNDPEYSEDSDNIMVQLNEWGFKGDDSIYGWNDGQNHNEYQHWEHPMSSEHHCWLYHCLYDHTELGWINILRIGRFWVDIKIEYQKIEGLDFAIT